VQERAQEIKAPATLEASESMDITSPDELTVERVNVAEGDQVNAGDALLRTSEQEAASKIARLRTDSKDAQATLEKNRYLLKNRDRLLEEGRIDRTQYDGLDTDVQSSEAAADKLQQQITRLEDHSGAITITSPTAGVVGKISIQAGSNVPAGRAMMSITRVDPLIAPFRLPSQNATAVKPGMAVRVKFPELGGEIAGKVTTVGTELNAEDNTFMVKAAVPNTGGRYKIGMRAEVVFTSTDKQRFFVIPEEALIKQRQAYFVFTVAKGIAHRVQVIPNETQGSRVEIARGLAEEDLVVVKGHDKLTDGAVVDIWGK